MTRLIAVLVGIALMAAPYAALADNVPDALAVEWQGQHPCQKLYEDSQIRIARCTFPPGAVHVCHSHPAYFSYTLSGGKAEVRDSRSTRQAELKTAGYASVPALQWHEVTNKDDTILTFLIVEKKYEPAAAADQQVCKQ